MWRVHGNVTKNRLRRLAKIVYTARATKRKLFQFKLFSYKVWGFPVKYLLPFKQLFADWVWTYFNTWQYNNKKECEIFNWFYGPFCFWPQWILLDFFLVQTGDFICWKENIFFINKYSNPKENVKIFCHQIIILKYNLVFYLNATINILILSNDLR